MDFQYPISVKASNLPQSYTVVDLETTGVNTAKDSIIEISALRVRDGIESGTFSTLVSCKGQIPKEASKINGITKDMLKGAPTIKEAIRAFSDFVGTDILIGHNANGFDRIFLEREISKLPDVSISGEWVDTLELARKMYPGESVSLKALCSKFGVRNKQAHRALSDCYATNACYREMRKKILATTTEAAAFKPRSGNPVDQKLAGKSFVFTGQAPGISRHDLMQLVVDHGGKVQDRVTLKTTHLVSGVEPGITKLKKAMEYAPRTDVSTINVSDFLEMVASESPKNEWIETSLGTYKIDKTKPEAKKTQCNESLSRSKSAGVAKTNAVELLLCIFLGYFGAYRFYRREYKIGLIYFFTVGLFGIGWVIDIVRLAAKYMQSANVPGHCRAVPGGERREVGIR